MFALRSPAGTQLRAASGTRSAAAPRPLALRNTFRVQATGGDGPQEKAARLSEKIAEGVPGERQKASRADIERERDSLRGWDNAPASSSGQQGRTSTSTPVSEPDALKALRQDYKLPSNGAVPLGTTPQSNPQYAIFNPITEAINGRAAMLGFIAAISTEMWTNQAVWHQIHGKYAGDKLVENPSPIGVLSFLIVVALVTLSTQIPKRIFDEDAKDRQWGPFNVSAEVWNGRAAQIGFAALLLTEWIKGSALFGSS